MLLSIKSISLSFLLSLSLSSPLSTQVSLPNKAPPKHLILTLLSLLLSLSSSLASSLPFLLSFFPSFLPSMPAPQPTTLSALESEMKLLHWHKLANEAALKAALIRTKKMRAADSKKPAKETLKEKAEHMQQVIEEEQAKPLQVGKDYIREYEADEKRNEEALQRQVSHHVTCLKNLRASIEKRETVRARKANFKHFKAEVEEERRQVMEGKAANADRFKTDTLKRTQEGGEQSVEKGGKAGGTLTTVIGSLDRLVELEKR